MKTLQAATDTLQEARTSKSYSYEKILKLEMRFKLEYKNKGNCDVVVKDAEQSLAEKRAELTILEKDLLRELRNLGKKRSEVLKSALMSAVEMHLDLEVDLESFYDNCARHSKQVRAKFSTGSMSLSLDAENSGEASGKQNQGS